MTVHEKVSFKCLIYKFIGNFDNSVKYKIVNSYYADLSPAFPMLF